MSGARPAFVHRLPFTVHQFHYHSPKLRRSLHLAGMHRSARPRRPCRRLAVPYPHREARGRVRAARKPRSLQSQAHPPSSGDFARGHRPAATRVIRAESPVRIAPGWLPAVPPSSKHHAAVEHAPEHPLEVVVLRGGRGVAREVEAHHDLVTPPPRGVRNPAEHEHRVGTAKQPERRGRTAEVQPELWRAERGGFKSGRLGDGWHLANADRVARCLYERQKKERAQRIIPDRSPGAAPAAPAAGSPVPAP